MTRIAFFCLTICTVASGAFAGPAAFATNFDTDQSSNFTSLQTSPGSPEENPIDFNFDYSTYVLTGLPVSPDVANTIDTIVPAPSGPATTIGVFMQCNIAGGGDSSSAQIQTNLTFAGDISMSVDCFSMHNGGGGGAAGSTNYYGLGFFGDRTTGAGIDGNTGGPGIIYTITGDGGSTADVRADSDVPPCHTSLKVTKIERLDDYIQRING